MILDEDPVLPLGSALRGNERRKVQFRAGGDFEVHYSPPRAAKFQEMELGAHKQRRAHKQSGLD